MATPTEPTTTYVPGKIFIMPIDGNEWVPLGRASEFTTSYGFEPVTGETGNPIMKARTSTLNLKLSEISQANLIKAFKNPTAEVLCEPMSLKFQSAIEIKVGFWKTVGRWLLGRKLTDTSRMQIVFPRVVGTASYVHRSKTGTQEVVMEFNVLTHPFSKESK